MTTEPLVYRQTNRAITVLTLQSPQGRNALTAELVKELGRALEEADLDPGVRAVLLTHAGDTFCSGADLRPEGRRRAPKLLAGLIERITRLSKPVVAHVDGVVRSGGVGLLAACDIAVAGSQASFGFPDGRLGMVPAVAAVPVLAGGDVRALSRYLLTGEIFDTPEAIRVGLVTAWDESLDGILAGLRASSPNSLQAIKAQLRVRPTELVTPHTQAGVSGRFLRWGDAEEGISAALEDRDPPWAV